MSGSRKRKLEAIVDGMPFAQLQSYRAHRRRVTRHQPYVLNLPPTRSGVWFAQEQAKGTRLYW